MTLTKLRTAEDFKLRNSFYAIRSVLLEPKYQQQLEKPLAYWALPSDRRLPLALMDRPLAKLLNATFEDLTATPGIGSKKIVTLVKLLRRVAETDVKESPMLEDSDLSVSESGRVARSSERGFDAENVSDSVWSNWCETIKLHELESEKLGRLAPTLQELPTAIWHTPLRHYMEKTLSEIRQMRTYGEKRVSTVLEVFYNIHDLLGTAPPNPYLSVRLAPAAIVAVQSWLSWALCHETTPDDTEIRAHLIQPLADQIKIDAGDDVFRLVCERFGQGVQRRSVREQAEARNVTRARIYQLFEMCGKILRVRWPSGLYEVQMLAVRANRADDPTSKLLDDVLHICFPDLTLPRYPTLKPHDD